MEDAMIDKAARSAQEKKPKGGNRKGRQTRAMRLPPDLLIKEHTTIPLAVQEAPEKWRLRADGPDADPLPGPKNQERRGRQRQNVGSTDPEGDVVYHWRVSKQAAEADSIIPECFNRTIQCDGGSEMAY